MSAKKRADLIGKVFKVVKKEYNVVSPPSNRTVLEHMMYGCCLEDSTFEAADEAFAKLQENFYDWNEIRVTTIREIAETVKCLSKPTEAATRVKKALHGVFEKYYQFDLEFLKKENLSRAVGEMEKWPGMSPFVISYTAQNGLAGHSIPIDKSFMFLMYVVGIVEESEVATMKITGLERTIPKAKGVEFSTLTHQLAVAFTGSPFSTSVRSIITKIAADAKERFPKRGAKKAAEKAAAKAKKEEAARAAKEEKERIAAEKAAEKAKAEEAAKKAAKKAAKASKGSKTAVKTKAKPAKKTTKKAAKKKATKKVASKSKSKTTKTSKAKKTPSKNLKKKKPR